MPHAIRGARINGLAVPSDKVARIVALALSRRYGRKNHNIRVDKDGHIIAILTLRKSDDCFCGGSKVAKGCDVCTQMRRQYEREAMTAVYKEMDHYNAEFKQWTNPDPENPLETQDLFLLLISFK